MMPPVPRSCQTIVGAFRLCAIAASLATLLSACATPPPANDPDAIADFRATNDPLEPTNRVFYAINNGIDTAILRPAAKAYRFVVPEPVRNGVHNVLSNITTPVQLSNDMLEGNPRRAGDTFMRFVINTTVGVLGVFDVAKGWGYPNHDSDFGMTLATWGVSEGPFLYLPILGPSNPRDAAGFGVDLTMDPFTWVGGPHNTGLKAFNWTRFALNAVDTRERLLDPIDQIKKTALDPYATFRSLYRQHRAAQIKELQDDNRHTIPVWFPQPKDTAAQ
jgi:phospholipid-binding lipoprotein MlaA